MKKAQMDEMMKKARTEQINSKEHFMAVQAQRERVEFERVLKCVSARASYIWNENVLKDRNQAKVLVTKHAA